MICLFALVMGLSGCQGIFSTDGAWEGIETDKESLFFSQEGGEQTVSMLNYNVWWIVGGFEGVEYENGMWEYVNYVFSTASGGSETHTNDILDGGWYHATVPDNGQSNKLVVTVDPNLTGSPRKATLRMESGDAFGNIILTQAY